jgi:fructose-1,6-bisphosphatase/inositol monophosphatase family enzyme
MIVKNEAAILSRCLDSVCDLMDEIIIVDTGSTDDTKAVAAKYTDRIYDFAWNNDFSAARNYSFSLATMDYIYAPYYEELSKKSFQMAYAYFKKALDVRRSGSAAIDLCSIAAGRAELYFELRLSPWDFAAGALIVEEAGGVVTTVEGGAVTLGQKCSVLATNGRCGRLE